MELGDETFFSVGGTEMAVMSTTSELKVAQKYAESEFPTRLSSSSTQWD